jgi:hypothetical protein|tara:strand:- start:2721 stop:3047 length:327 start_codon:yes stop_codon:yes gene_type:complete
MSILRSVDPDGTKYFFEDDGTLTVKNSQDVEPILKKNKRMYNDGDGYSASKDLKRVASIPTLVLTLWAKEYNGSNNWFGLPADERKKILKRKLNSNEFRYFRTASGNL